MRLDVSQNLLQEFFTDEQARKRHPHRDDDAPVVVARFRSQAARYSGDPGFTAWSPACTGTVRNSRNRGTATRSWRAPAGPSSCTTRRSGTSRSPGPHWTSPPASPCVSPLSSRSPEPARKRPWNPSRALPAKSTFSSGTGGQRRRSLSSGAEDEEGVPPHACPTGETLRRTSPTRTFHSGDHRPPPHLSLTGPSRRPAGTGGCRSADQPPTACPRWTPSTVHRGHATPPTSADPGPPFPRRTDRAPGSCWRQHHDEQTLVGRATPVSARGMSTSTAPRTGPHA